MIWQYLNNISTNYVFGGSRYEPYDTDCSGIVCAGCWQKLGIEPSQLGVWTGAQWASPILETIWEGTTPNLPWNLMQEDDLIFTSTESPLFDSEWGSHVGLYTGDSNMPFLSHFKDGGPYITKVNGVYGGMECYFGVRRLKQFMGSVWDDTSYQEPFATGASMGTRIVYMDMYINEIRNALENLPAKLWEYNYENTAPFGNMYNTAVQTNLFIQDVKREFEKLNERLAVMEKKIDDIR